MQIINGVKCRTRIESLNHIIKQAKKAKIGINMDKGDKNDICQYEFNSGNNCGVGSLFDKKQLKWLKKEELNESSITYVAQGFVGKKNIETVTGMKLRELVHIQALHDHADDGQEARARLIAYCEEELTKLNAQEP
jgi:hypothetical protein